jgi:hypothetical protein
MTEAEWLGSTNPVAMLEHLGRQPRSRKHRLFALACCHRCRRFITDPRSLAALEFAERHIEAGVAGRRGRQAIEDAAAQVYTEQDVVRNRLLVEDPVKLTEVLIAIGGTIAAQRLVSLGDDSQTATLVAEFLDGSVADEWTLHNHGDKPYDWHEEAQEPELVAQAELVRDIFGNLFRPVVLDPSWLTRIVVSLARSAYDDRILPSGELDPQRLTILADALEEAGCADAMILGHLRGPGQHVRGCWLVDLCLGLK